MTEYIPKVSEADITRILNRDYAADQHNEIKELTEHIIVSEKQRVIVACFKNSNGDITKLKNQLKEANGYWREIIGEAEYPKIKKASRLKKEQIHEKQKQQYLQWFNK